MDYITFVQDIFTEDTRLKHMDISEGSNIYDLVIKPLAIILEENIDEEILEGTSDELDLSKYATMTYDELIKFARNHFIEVPEDNVTKGEVYMHLSDPVDVSIEAGAILYAGENQFELEYDIEFAKGDYKIEDGLYKTPSIMIKNSDGLTAEANTIGSIDGAPDELIKITHLDLYSGMSQKTTNEMYARILGALSAGKYISSLAIQKAINRACGVDVRVEVIGQGDDLMARDSAYNVSGSNDNINAESGFFGKIRGRASSLVYNANKAFKVFVSALGGELTEEDGIELLQDGYITISNVDTNTITITTESVLEEEFGLSSEVGGSQRVIDVNALLTDVTLHLDDMTSLEAGQMIKIVSYDGSGEKEKPVLNVIKEVNTSTMIITLYTSIGKAITSTTIPSPYIEILDSVGYSLGQGWVRGEDGMSLGRTLSDQEVMVVDGKLMLGIPDADFGGNVVVETIVKMGVANFLDAIKKSIIIQKLSKVKEKTYPTIPMVERNVVTGIGGNDD